MLDVVFYLFAAVTLLSAIMVPCSRNPVNAAMFMIVAFVGTAGLFAMLGAFFLAILQVLVYAGAVMVLFLFIIMLLNVDKSAKRPLDAGALISSVIGLIALSGGMYYLFMGENAGPWPAQPEGMNGATAKEFGYSLFTKYLLPVQMVGFLLLIAMVGVIFISKKTQEPADASSDAELKRTLKDETEVQS